MDLFDDLPDLVMSQSESDDDHDITLSHKEVAALQDINISDVCSNNVQVQEVTSVVLSGSELFKIFEYMYTKIIYFLLKKTR